MPGNCRKAVVSCAKIGEHALFRLIILVALMAPVGAFAQALDMHCRAKPIFANLRARRIYRLGGGRRQR
jgi:hypothetical protein